jgi:hypothetical protein
MLGPQGFSQDGGRSDGRRSAITSLAAWIVAIRTAVIAGLLHLLKNVRRSSTMK